MSYLLPEPKKDLPLPAPISYLIAVISVMVGYALVLGLERLHVRDPYALIFLAAIWISVWVGGDGPGNVALLLSTLGLTVFLHSQSGWLHLTRYDYPVYFLYFIFAFLIYRFSRMRRRIEMTLQQERDCLEQKVQDRTLQLTVANKQYEAINARYKQILDALPFAVALLDPGRIVRVCNRAYEVMLGYKSDELLGKTAPLPESERETWEIQEKGLHAGERLEDYEGPRLRRDGTEFPAKISAIPLFGEDGVYSGLVGTIVDMTQTHALQRERQMLIALVQHSPGFIGVADIQTGAVVFVNPCGQHMFGLEGVDEVKQSTVDKFLAEDECVRAMTEVLPALVQQGNLAFETVGRNSRTGRTFPLDCTGFVIPDAKTGEPALIAAVAQDVTERRRTQEEIRRRDAYLTEGQSISHTGSWAWRAATQEGFMSSELFRILGYEPDTVPPTPRTFYEAIHPEDQEAAEAAWQKAVSERTAIDHKHRIVRPDGSIRFVHSLGHPVENKTGRVEFIGTIIDVTQHHDDRAALERALEENKLLQEQLRKENISIKESYRILQDDVAANQKTRYGHIIGSSSVLRDTLIRVDRVAPTEATVLITGETGTGKELIAQAIHQNSRRASGHFFAVDCAGIPASLIRSELFGHEKSSFTGADRQHIGWFEAAEDGTIFLDEIGDMPLETQVILLRFLQERTFQRIGSTKTITSNVRVVAATNRDLRTAMGAGTFRKDLFYRLNEFAIEMPPLRTRREDIPILVRHFLEILSEEHEKYIPNVEKRAMDLLVEYGWPGNIRQLKSAIKAAVIACDGDTLTLDMFSSDLQNSQIIDESPAGVPFTMSVLDYERKGIEQALQQSNGQVGGRGGAAERLGISISKLRSRMDALGINAHRFHAKRPPGE